MPFHEVPPLMEAPLPGITHQQVIKGYFAVLANRDRQQLREAEFFYDPVLFPDVDRTPTRVINGYLSGVQNQANLLCGRQATCETVSAVLCSVVLGNAVELEELGELAEAGAAAIAKADLTHGLSGYRRHELRHAILGLQSDYDPVPGERSREVIRHLPGTTRRIANWLIAGLGASNSHITPQ